MSTTNSASSEVRRRYPTFLQVGLIAALGLAVAAFTIDLPNAKPTQAANLVDAPLELVQVDITQQTESAPPPAAQPPPVEVVDDVDVVEDVIAEVVLDFEGSILPAGPPAGPVSPPPAPPVNADTITPPPVEEDFDAGDEVIDFVEVEPMLIGGLEGLQSRVDYPEFARRVGAEGTVFVQFVVERNGAVSNVVIVRSPNDLLSAAAAKAVTESRFEPGSQQGRAVRVRYTVPVNFVLR